MELSRRELLKLGAAMVAAAAVGVKLPVSKAEAAAAEGVVDGWTKTVCRFCGTGCGVMVGVKGGKVVAVKGDTENPVNRGFVCMKGYFLPKILYAEDRLKYPLIRKGDKFVRASWDEALDLVAGKFKEAIEKYGPDSVAYYGSGQALTEESYIANKLFKGGIGTNNVEGNPRTCMASAVVGYITTFGKDEPMGSYEDLDYADCYFIIGANMAEQHPILFRRIAQRKAKNPNVKVIVADPRYTPTNRIADLSLRFVPGTDLAILNAMANVIVQENLVNQEFIKEYVTFMRGEEKVGLEEYVQFLADYTPEKVAEVSGAPAEQIRQAALYFAKAGGTVSLWTMGLNQRTRGVWVNNLVHNLHLITGQICRPGATPFSLTGQPNACGGVRDTGALSHALPAGRVIANPQHRAEIEAAWGLPAGKIAAKPGLHTMAMFQALEEGKIKAMLILCTNPGQSLPSLERYRKAMNGDSFVVVTEAYHPTRTSELADVVLPAAMWVEKEGVYGCGERRYQYMAKMVDPPGEARPDVWILTELARRLGHEKLIPYRSAQEVWDEWRTLSKTSVYNFYGMPYERLKKERGLLWPCPTEDHPGTKRRYVKGEDPLVKGDKPIEFYGRPDKRAVVYLRPQMPPAEVVDAEYPFYLTTGRVIEHWHTGTMTMKVPELRRAVSNAFVEINPADAKRLGIREGDPVKLTSRRGSLVLEAKVIDRPREGLVFAPFFDAQRLVNLLTNDTVDADSKEMEFKICAVKVERA